jgi:hypothetical protein
MIWQLPEGMLSYHPNRRQPHSSVFVNVDPRLSENRQFGPNVWDRGRFANDGAVERDEQILELVNDNPAISIRTITQTLGTSTCTVWRALRRDRLHPYHYTRVQALPPEDYKCRIIFCEWILNWEAQNENFFDKIFFTNETTFSRNGVLRNLHYWCHQNPHLFRAVHIQHKVCLNSKFPPTLHSTLEISSDQIDL